MRIFKIALCSILATLLLLACAHAEEPAAQADPITVKGVFTGSFSEARKEESAQPGMADCLVVFDCAGGAEAGLPAAASGITLSAGGETYEIFDVGGNQCQYLINVHRYCDYAEPLGYSGEPARMLALFYVDPAKFPGQDDILLTVGDQTASFPAADVKAVELPDDILSVEDDPEKAHRLADWRWRMDSIIRFDNFYEKVYVNRMKLITGDHFTYLGTANLNLLDESIPYGISIAAMPQGNYTETAYGILFDGGEDALTDREPPFDLEAVKNMLPEHIGLIQYLVDNSRAATKTMMSVSNKTGNQLDELREKVGIAYLDLCDAMGMQDLGQFFDRHPAAQVTEEFIDGLRASGKHVPADALAKAEADANAALNDKKTVKAVQQALNDAGFDCGTPDGSAGKKTAAAISAYQEANGLEVTGKIDRALLISLGI